MYAKFHFTAIRDTSKACSKYEHLYSQPKNGSSRANNFFSLKCDPNSQLVRGNYGTRPYTDLRIVIRSRPFDRQYMAEEGDVDGLVWEGVLKMRGRGISSRHSYTNELYLITTCQIDEHDKLGFLNQFLIARNHILFQPGFIRHHFFESVNQLSSIRYINIASWRSEEDFYTAFSSSRFKNIIDGGFDRTSEIIVAHRAE